MLDNTFQLLPWTNIMTTSSEKKDFFLLVCKFDNFFSKCLLESQPDWLLQSPMPKFQSCPILGTDLLSTYLGDQCSPMMNLQCSTWYLQTSLAFTGLPEPSQVGFSRIPYSTVPQIWLHVAIGPSIHIYFLSKSNHHNSFNIQYYLIVPSSLFFTFTLSRSSKWPLKSNN